MRLLIVFTLIFSSLFAGEWMSDYDKALMEARTHRKPLVVAFLGTGWCPWSQKLQIEVLSTQEFQLMLDSFVLVNLSISEWNSKEGRLAELKEQFDIQEVPIIIALDPSETEMARIGYMPYSPEEFASLFQGIKESFEEIRNASLSTLNAEALQDLYLKALKFGFNTYRYELLAQGLKTDKTPFFLLEKYKLLVESGKSKDTETLSVRKELLKRDPKNKFGVHRTLAIVDFHQLSNRYRLRKKPDEVVKPLMEYVKKFGQNDPEHLWKIEMMMAQFYFNREKPKEALVHAQAALVHAPDSAHEEIQQSIILLKSKS